MLPAPPISSTPTPSHQPSSTLLPPSTPSFVPSPRPWPLLLPAHTSKNFTVESQHAIIRLPSSSVLLAQVSPSPRIAVLPRDSERDWVLCLLRSEAGVGRSRVGVRPRISSVSGDGLLSSPRRGGFTRRMSCCHLLASRALTAS